MIIINSEESTLGASRLKNLTIKLFNYNLSKLKIHNSLGLKQMLTRYTMEDLRESFNSISIDDKGNIYIPENTRQNLIIRYLEFGGEGIRATHILTNVKKDLSNILGKETIY